MYRTHRCPRNPVLGLGLSSDGGVRSRFHASTIVPGSMLLTYAVFTEMPRAKVFSDTRRFLGHKKEPGSKSPGSSKRPLNYPPPPVVCVPLGFLMYFVSSPPL